jgi:hypothetical protein
LLVRALFKSKSKVNRDGVGLVTAAATDECTHSPRKHKWVVRLYVAVVPLATCAWLAGIGWIAIRLTGYVLS